MSIKWISRIQKDQSIEGGDLVVITGNMNFTCRVSEDVQGATPVSGDKTIETVLDIDGDSFAAVNSVDNTTVPGTTGLVDVVSEPFTDGADMDSVAKGEKFRLKVTRDAVSDDAAGDAELGAVEIRET